MTEQETMDKVVDRIRKLLELSKSSNEHEAALAAARAAELMVEHQMAEAELEAPTSTPKVEPVAVETLDRFGKIVSWRFVVASGVARSVGGDCVSGLDWDRWASWNERLDGSPPPKRLRVFAPRSALPVVQYMYSYLCNEVERLADAAYREPGRSASRSARAWKSAFRMAAADVICDRLESQRKVTLDRAKQEGRTQALSVIDRQTALVEKEVQIHCLGGAPRSFSSKAGRTSYPGYAAGAEAARGINLGGNPQIGSGRRQLKPGKR